MARARGAPRCDPGDKLAAHDIWPLLWLWRERGGAMCACAATMRPPGARQRVACWWRCVASRHSLAPSPGKWACKRCGRCLARRAQGSNASRRRAGPCCGCALRRSGGTTSPLIPSVVGWGSGSGRLAHARARAHDVRAVWAHRTRGVGAQAPGVRAGLACRGRLHMGARPAARSTSCA